MGREALMKIWEIDAAPEFGVPSMKVCTTMAVEEVAALIGWMYAQGMEITEETVVKVIDYGGIKGWWKHIALTMEQFDKAPKAYLSDNILKDGTDRHKLN